MKIIWWSIVLSPFSDIRRSLVHFRTKPWQKKSTEWVPLMIINLGYLTSNLEFFDGLKKISTNSFQSWKHLWWYLKTNSKNSLNIFSINIENGKTIVPPTISIFCSLIIKNEVHLFLLALVPHRCYCHYCHQLSQPTRRRVSLYAILLTACSCLETVATYLTSVTLRRQRSTVVCHPDMWISTWRSCKWPQAIECWKK